MMGHVGAHQRATLAFLDALRGVIQCFVKSVARKSAFAFEHPQIFHRLSRRYVRCKNGRVRRNYQVFDQTALQAQTGNAERSVLIVEMKVTRSEERRVGKECRS